MWRCSARENRSLLRQKKAGPGSQRKAVGDGRLQGERQRCEAGYVSAHWREPFSDKPSMVLVFTEKDHSKDKKPDFNAAFGKFGSALIISLHEDGGIFGCQVVHSAHQKQDFSSIGSIKTNNFKFEEGKVEGELTTDGQVDTLARRGRSTSSLSRPLERFQKSFSPQRRRSPKQRQQTNQQQPSSAKSPRRSQRKINQSQRFSAYERCIRRRVHGAC